jgi:hypothetical protein
LNLESVAVPAARRIESGRAHMPESTAGGQTMPYMRVNVAFTAGAAVALRAELGADWNKPRVMFTLEPLRTIAKLPGAGDLVADVRLSTRVWRVEQRSLQIDTQANATVSLLVGEAPQARLTSDVAAERVHLTDNAQAAVMAEHVGRDHPPSECRALMVALSATPDLRAGDVVQDAGFSRHLFLIDERLFLWTETNEVLVRYLLDVGAKPGDGRL